MKEAEPAVATTAKPGEQTKIMGLLRLDRNLLELMAVRGRNITGYANRKSQIAAWPQMTKQQTYQCVAGQNIKQAHCTAAVVLLK